MRFRITSKTDRYRCAVLSASVDNMTLRKGPGLISHPDNFYAKCMSKRMDTCLMIAH